MKKCVISLILLVFFIGSTFAEDAIIDEVILEPKDPILGTVIAIGPGLLAHGFGHFYAEDYERGLLLFGTEIASLLTFGAGYIQYRNAEDATIIGGDNSQETERGAVITMGVGVFFFLATWVADIATAGEACRQYNIEHGLEFKMQQESNIMTPSLMFAYDF